MRTAKGIGLALLVGLVSVVTGCNSSTETPAPVVTPSAASPACTYSLGDTSICVIFKAAANQAQVDSFCSQMTSGTTSASCASASRQGTCTSMTGASAAAWTSMTYYTGGSGDGAAACADTAIAGTWNAGA